MGVLGHMRATAYCEGQKRMQIYTCSPSEYQHRRDASRRFDSRGGAEYVMHLLRLVGQSLSVSPAARGWLVSAGSGKPKPREVPPVDPTRRYLAATRTSMTVNAPVSKTSNE